MLLGSFERKLNSGSMSEGSIKNAEERRRYETFCAPQQKTISSTVPNASWCILANMSIRIYVCSTLQRDGTNCMAISATGSNVQCMVPGRRRGKCRMGNCGWKFTFLGLKDADLRGESDAANCLCMQCLFAEIFTKRPKHQI